jgi:hypothetical protein
MIMTTSICGAAGAQKFGQISVSAMITISGSTRSASNAPGQIDGK